MMRLMRVHENKLGSKQRSPNRKLRVINIVHRSNSWIKVMDKNS